MLLKMTEWGMYCEAGDFFIDPMEWGEPHDVRGVKVSLHWPGRLSRPS